MRTALVILLLAGSAAWLPASPFTANKPSTREYFRALCDYTAREKADVTVIFTAGYFMRNLVAGYKIFGDKRYLDIAVAYGDGLLAKQSERGYWQTGYAGRIYLADTASALGLFIVLYPQVDSARQQRYRAAMQRYVDAIERDRLIRPSGALDVGLRTDANGLATVPYDQDYTTSSALTGGEIFTWMYHATKVEKYREVAHRTQQWILSTMRADGVIPYNHPGGKSDLRIKNNPQNDHMLWVNSLYLNSAYVGEGLLSFDLYCGRPDWQQEVRAKIKPHIDYVLKTQNPDGSWAPPSNWDQKRSPGIVNFLIWYWQHVERDPRIPAATRKFEAFILNPENGRKFGLLNAGAVPDLKVQQEVIGFDCVTGLTGRALADMIQPGVDAQW
jgi:rhamnogalacturonyl hydrolase YesR